MLGIHTIYVARVLGIYTVYVAHMLGIYVVYIVCLLGIYTVYIACVLDIHAVSILLIFVLVFRSQDAIILTGTYSKCGLGWIYPCSTVHPIVTLYYCG